MRVIPLAILLAAACGEVEAVYPDAGADGGPDATDADPAAPETTLTVTPQALTTETLARFEFRADRPATFTCRLDGGPPESCTSPRSLTVTDGAHTFEVTATSAEGVADPSPARHAWTVDTEAPTVTIADPATPTSDPTPAFAFTTAGDPVRIECRIDAGMWGPCTSATTHVAPALTDGMHTFAVRAVDAAGHEGSDSVPVVIDTVAPTLTFTAVPADPNPLDPVDYAWTTAGGVTQTECTPVFRTGTTEPAFAACTSPRSVDVPTHTGQVSMTFRVRVRDAAGNQATFTDTFMHYIIQ